MLSKEEINEKLEWLRKSFPRRPTPSPFIKINQERKMETTTYTQKEVMWFIQNVFDSYQLEETCEIYSIDFEERLNNQWLNWNNWDNEDKMEEFHEQHLESFIY